ncbi:MAG: VCBS repeat-containing protein [Planctomyces sp.]|nr:VCBS repeat-containing protein [Planctomyces sp.]
MLRVALHLVSRFAVARAVAGPATAGLIVLGSLAGGCTSGDTGASQSVATDRPPAEKAAPGERAPSGPPVLMPAPEFLLTDQSGAPFGARDLKGQVWIVNFMFTRCAATCPQQTSRIAELQNRARRWQGAERLKLLSITVDPVNDTPQRLAEYGQRFQADAERWKFLTGERDVLRAISGDGFKLPVSDSDDPRMPIAHSARFALVDANGSIRGFYDSLADGDFERLAVDARHVLAEATATPPDPSRINIPPDVAAPAWMAQREADQRATRDEFTVPLDFEFFDRREESGITFVNRAVEDCTKHFKSNHYDHANGIAAADVDGDGLPDLYFTSQVGGNELWRNLGDGRFEDITDLAGVRLAGRVSVSASFADVNNDGAPDLFVTTTRHGNVLFINDGQGRFRDATEEAGLGYVGHSSGAVFFDYDGDGRLDLLVTNVGNFTTDEVGDCCTDDEEPRPYYLGLNEAFVGHLFADRAERSSLFRNEGEGRFRDVSEETGLVDLGWSGDATPLDYNGDGWIDLYILNMQGNDELWENQQGERFVRRGETAFPMSVWGGMGVKSFDFDGDGRLDLYITNMHADMWELQKDINGPAELIKPPPYVMPESYLRTRPGLTNVLGNGLYLNRGDGEFEEVSDEVGAETYWPWGLSVGDLNADGHPDVFITSGMNYPFRYHVNTVLMNDGGTRLRPAEFLVGVEPRRGGRTATPWFQLDCSGEDAGHELCRGKSGTCTVWGALGSRGSVILDLDGDGDLDIVTNDFNSPPQVLISDLAQRSPDLKWLAIALRGTRGNSDGLGAIVTVRAGERRFTQAHDGKSGYLSQSRLPLYFGLGGAERVDEVRVVWPGGQTQTVAGPIDPNQTLAIEESAAQ